ncbi:hypothetical protein LXL04_024789 [Taraxacum kok-saghyz]
MIVSKNGEVLGFSGKYVYEMIHEMIHHKQKEEDILDVHLAEKEAEYGEGTKEDNEDVGNE